jgi:hypothetical protein
VPHKDPEARRAYMREYHRKWRANNPEKVKEYRRRAVFGIKKWRAAHPEKVKDYARRSSAKYRANNLERVRKRDLVYYRQGVYGISELEYHEMVVAQAGRCLICGSAFKKTPHIDHDHATGRVRGLLCGRCNVGIAMLAHNPTVLRSAIRYLEENAHASAERLGEHVI